MIEDAHKRGQDLPEKVQKLLKTTPVAQQVDIENKMSMREKQRAKRKYLAQEEDEFEKSTGIRKPDSPEEARERFHYDMARMELKESKIN